MQYARICCIFIITTISIIYSLRRPVIPDRLPQGYYTTYADELADNRCNASRQAEDAPTLGVPYIDDRKRILKFYEKPQDPDLIHSLRLSDDFMGKNNLDRASGKRYLASMAYTYLTAK